MLLCCFIPLPPPTPNICLLHSCIRSLQVAWLLGAVVSKGKKPARNKFTWHDFMNFSHNNFSRLTTFSVSGSCISFTFKICQIVAGISMTSQFSRIYLSNYWRIFAIWFHCALWCLRTRVRILHIQCDLLYTSVHSELYCPCVL